MHHTERNSDDIVLAGTDPAKAPDVTPLALNDAALTRPLSSRERILGTMQGRGADVVPAAPAYLCLTLDPAYTAAYIRGWKPYLEQSARTEFDHERDTEIRAHALITAYQSLSVMPDWIEVPLGLARAQSQGSFLQPCGEGLLFSGRISGARDRSSDSSGLPCNHMLYRAVSGVFYTPHVKGRRVESASEVDVLMPTLTANQLLQSGAFDLPARIAAQYGDRHCLSTVLNTPYSFAYSLLGFEGLMLKQQSDPSLLHRVLERSLDRALAMVSALKVAGLHGVYFQEVMSGADAISPVAFEQYSLRYLRPLIKHAAQEGLFSVLYFSGNSMPRLELLAGMGPSALALEESKKDFRCRLRKWCGAWAARQ